MPHLPTNSARIIRPRTTAYGTCINCPWPYKYDGITYTERCKPCNATAAARKRVRSMARFMHDTFIANTAKSIVHITLTFGDDQIDKTKTFNDLNKIAKTKFARMRERSEYWRTTFTGGIYGFEATKRPYGLHPHIHIVAYMSTDEFTKDLPFSCYQQQGIAAFKKEIQKYGFGGITKIEQVYKSVYNKVTDEYEKVYHDNDPEGAIYYAMKYCAKKDPSQKGIRTISKFGELYGRRTQKLYESDAKWFGVPQHVYDAYKRKQNIKKAERKERNALRTPAKPMAYKPMNWQF